MKVETELNKVYHLTYADREIIALNLDKGYYTHSVEGPYYHIKFDKTRKRGNFFNFDESREATAEEIQLLRDKQESEGNSEIVAQLDKILKKLKPSKLRKFWNYLVK